MAGIDGIYFCYMSGSEGNGVGMFNFQNGIISGADPLGVLFDGSFSENEDGTFHANVTVHIPSGGTVIQGASAGPAGLTYQVPLILNADFADSDFIPIETPLGDVNVRFKKLRSLGEI